MYVDETSLREMVYGGGVLGAGGGGSIAAGLAAVRETLAIGHPRVVELNQVPARATLATLSSVGTTGAVAGASVNYRHFARALELFVGLSDRSIDGFISSEVGPRAVTYGLREAALIGIPVVDAPCNGRAHPLFAMGSLGLHRFPRHHAVTVAVGGKPGTAEYLELAVRANVSTSARIVREQVARAGISLAVVRNPVSASFVGEHAAVGALGAARRIGRILLSLLHSEIAVVLRGLAQATGGRAIGSGRVSSAGLLDQQGFTTGSIVIERDGRSDLTIPVCNEFMMVINRNSVLAAFPDVIALFDWSTRLPLASTEVEPGRVISIFVVPSANLILGSTMQDADLLRPIERLLGVGFPVRPRAPTPFAEVG